MFVLCTLLLLLLLFYTESSSWTVLSPRWMATSIGLSQKEVAVMVVGFAGQLKMWVVVWWLCPQSGRQLSEYMYVDEVPVWNFQKV